MNVKDPGSRLLRWRTQLAEYDYEITYRRGSQSIKADALSRIGSVSKEDERSDEFDEDRKRQILYEFHDSPVGSHRGMNKTYSAIMSQYFWPNISREVEEYVKQCRSCQVNKMLTPKHKDPMEITATAKHPFDKCYLDIVGPLPVTQGNNKYILTFQDDRTKYVVAVPIRQQDAETVARAFVANVMLNMVHLEFCKLIKALTSLTQYLETPARSFRSRKFNLLRFILNHKGVLRGAIVCWLST